MALKNSDLFVVQRVVGTEEEKGTYKMDAEQIQKYVEAGPSVNFWGTVDLTKAPLGGAAGDQLHDGLMPSNGDLYINDNGGQAGVQIVHPGWNTENGGPGGQNCVAGDRIVWDATPGIWRLIKDAGNVGGIVQTVGGGNGILVTGSDAEPVVNADFGGDAAWGEAGTDAAVKVASVAKVKEYVTAGTIEPGTYVLVSGDTMTGDLRFAENRSDATPSVQIERSGGIIRKAKLRGQLQEAVSNNADPDYTLSKDDGLIVKSATTSGNGVTVLAGGNAGGAVKATISNDGSAAFAGGNTLINENGSIVIDLNTPGTAFGVQGGAAFIQSNGEAFFANTIGIGGTYGNSNISLGTAGSGTFAGQVTCGADPSGGAGTGAILNQTGVVKSGRAEETDVIWQGFHVGDSTATSTIYASGGANFAAGNIVLDSTGVVQVLRGAKNPIFEGYLGPGILPANKKLTLYSDGGAEFANSQIQLDTNGRYLSNSPNQPMDIGTQRTAAERYSILTLRSNTSTPGSGTAVVDMKSDGSANFASNVVVPNPSAANRCALTPTGINVVRDTADAGKKVWSAYGGSTETSVIYSDGSSDFKGNMTFTASNGETNILLNPDGRAFFAGNNSRFRDTFPSATTYIEGGNPDDNEYGRIYMQHKDLPAFGWVKLSPDESRGGTSNDGVVITRGYARETLENVNKIMVFQGAFDLTEYVPYKSDIPNPNPNNIKSIEGAGAIDGVDGSGLRPPHPGDIVSHVPSGFFVNPEDTPRSEEWYQHEANGKRYNAFAWRRPSPEDMEADESLTYGHIYTTTGTWVLAASIYDGSANPASHPLWRDPNAARPQTVSTGDMNGRGRNWYATLGQALDFNPLQLLQNLESVTSVGKDSTTGMFLCCDATLDGPNGTPIRDENDLLIPNRDTARIKLNDDGSASFAGGVTSLAPNNQFTFAIGANALKGGLYNHQNGGYLFLRDSNSNGTITLNGADGTAQFDNTITSGSTTKRGQFLGTCPASIPAFSANAFAASYDGNIVASIKYDGGASFQGKVGIGTNAPTTVLHISKPDVQLRLQNTDSYSATKGPLIQFQGKGPNNSNYNFAKIQAFSSGANNAGVLSFFTNNAGVQSERMRLDNIGRLLIGQSSAINNNNASGQSARYPKVSIFNNPSLVDERYTLALNGGSPGKGGPLLGFNKSRSTNSTVDNHTIIQENDDLGDLQFRGSDGTHFVVGAKFLAECDGSPGINNMPGRITLWTTSAGNSAPTERLRIDSKGQVGVGTTDPKVLFQVKDYGGFDGNGNQLLINNNVYYATTNKAVKTGYSTQISLTNQDGSIRFRSTASSASAGGEVTLVERMRINNSGSLLIGNSNTSSAQIELNADGSAEFAGDIKVEKPGEGSLNLYSSGHIRTYRGTSNPTDSLLQLRSDFGGGAATQVQIFADGKAKFAGETRVGGAFIVHSNLEAPGNYNAFINPNDGSAEFAGTIKAGGYNFEDLLILP